MLVCSLALGGVAHQRESINSVTTLTLSHACRHYGTNQKKEMQYIDSGGSDVAKEKKGCTSTSLILKPLVTISAIHFMEVS